MKDIQESLDQIQSFYAENPQQTRSGCIYKQSAQYKKIHGYNIKDEIFKECTFNKAILIQCVFENCSFIQCIFTNICCFNVRFINCTFSSCDFSNAQLNDTNFNDCRKIDCILDHIKRAGLSKGLTNADANVIQDNDSNNEVLTEDDENSQNTSEESRKTTFKRVQKLISNNETFSKWIKDQDGLSFSLMDKSETGFAFAPASEKNTTDSDDFWQLIFFFENESLNSIDVNLFGLSDNDICKTVQNWKKTLCTETVACDIMNKIIEFIEG